MMVDEQTRISTEEVATMVRRAGLELRPEEFEGLIDALAHVEAKVRLVRERIGRSDESASVFRIEAES